MSEGRVRISGARIVYNDGNHNAFTDLCRFRGRFYLTFRSCPDGHMIFPTSRIVVLASEDGRAWQNVLSFHVPGRDVRDPHLLAFQGRLFVYTGTWLCDPDDPNRREINEHLGYAAWSEDGQAWQGPQFLEGTYGHYIWRAATYGGKAYLCGRRKRAFARTASWEEQEAILESALLESDDGLIWKPVGLFQETHGNETAFLFEERGEILAIARGKHPRPALLCRSRPPYKVWRRQELERDIGGPLLAKWGDRYLVGGRQWGGPKGPVTALYWLVGDRLHPIAELPSGGDNSYPGFVPLSKTRGLVSWYSSHEGSGTHLAPSAIYLAELVLVDHER